MLPLGIRWAMTNRIFIVFLRRNSRPDFFALITIVIDIVNVLKYWNIEFDIEWQLKYLLNNKLAKYPKRNENENEPKNIGYYCINKNVKTE